MRYYHLQIFWCALLFSVLLLAGCGRREMSGAVRSSQMTNDGYQLSFSPSDSSGYVFVETKALVGDQVAAVLHNQNATNTLIRLGTQYVGRQIRVAGHIQRDQAGRKFILVTNRDQITLLR
jgi:hypothetical protein